MTPRRTTFPMKNTQKSANIQKHRKPNNLNAYEANLRQTASYSLRREGEPLAGEPREVASLDRNRFGHHLLEVLHVWLGSNVRPKEKLKGPDVVELARRPFALEPVVARAGQFFGPMDVSQSRGRVDPIFDLSLIHI